MLKVSKYIKTDFLAKSFLLLWKVTSNLKSTNLDWLICDKILKDWSVMQKNNEFLSILFPITVILFTL